MVRIDLVDEQFGDLLKSLQLPENWREVIRRDMVAQALAAGVTPETVEREKERLKLKKSRTIKLYKEGYIDEEEFQGEMAAVELALKQLDAPEVDGVTYGEVIEAGEHLPRARREPHSGKRRPLWTASSPKAGPKWVWSGCSNYLPYSIGVPPSRRLRKVLPKEK